MYGLNFVSESQYVRNSQALDHDVTPDLLLPTLREPTIFLQAFSLHLWNMIGIHREIFGL